MYNVYIYLSCWAKPFRFNLLQQIEEETNSPRFLGPQVSERSEALNLETRDLCAVRLSIIDLCIGYLYRYLNPH